MKISPQYSNHAEVLGTGTLAGRVTSLVNALSSSMACTLRAAARLVCWRRVTGSAFTLGIVLVAMISTTCAQAGLLEEQPIDKGINVGDLRISGPVSLLPHSIGVKGAARVLGVAAAELVRNQGVVRGVALGMGGASGSGAKGAEKAVSFFIPHEWKFVVGDWIRLVNGVCHRGAIIALLASNGELEELWVIGSSGKPTKLAIDMPEAGALWGGEGGLLMQHSILGWTRKDMNEVHLAGWFTRAPRMGMASSALLVFGGGAWSRATGLGKGNDPHGSPRFHSLCLALAGDRCKVVGAASLKSRSDWIFDLDWSRKPQVAGLDAASMVPLGQETQTGMAYLVPAYDRNSMKGGGDSYTVFYSTTPGYPGWLREQGGAKRPRRLQFGELRTGQGIDGAEVAIPARSTKYGRKC